MIFCQLCKNQIQIELKLLCLFPKSSVFRQCFFNIFRFKKGLDTVSNSLSSPNTIALLFLANMIIGVLNSVSGKEVPGVLESTNLCNCESSEIKTSFYSSKLF